MIRKTSYTNNKNISIAIFIISFIACIYIIFSFASFNKNINQAPIKNGVLDLSNWDFHKDGTIELTGEWRFYWNELVTYEDLLNNSKEITGIIKVPGIWNGYKVDNEELKGQGYATYGLRINLGEKREKLAFKIPGMLTSYNLYINGELIAKNGVVERDKYLTKAEEKDLIVDYSGDESTLDILFQIANFKHRKGGIPDKILLGTQEEIQSIRYKEIFSDLFLFASIFIMAFYHLVIYLIYRKKVSYLLFSMYCFVVAGRIIVTGANNLSIMFPNISWDAMQRMEYLSFYIAVPVFAASIYYIFTEQFSKKVLHIISGIAIAFILVVITAKPIIYTYTLIPFQIFTVFVAIYINYVLVKGYIQKVEGALITIVGFLVVTITSINDILLANNLIYTGNKFPVGVIVFVFLQAVVLGQNILKSLIRTELLVKENSNMVVEIMKLNLSLEKRNKELNDIAIHDRLTGVYNRAFYESIIIELDKEENLPISIIIGDVNGLKLVNDAFGHFKGDMLLKKIVEILRISCRKEDIIARIGGDEFIIILPSSDAEIAERVMRDIRESCEKADFHPIKPSISLGFSVKYHIKQSINDVIKEADDYMYKRKLLESKSTRSSIIDSLQKTLEETTFETREHAKRLENLSVRLGKELRLPENNLDDLLLVAMLHDIGKIAIPPNIITKPGKLTKKEWDIIKRHPEIGYQIASSSPELRGIAQLILSHHERWDGEGYPQKLKGEEIPLLARIVAIVDSFDAMTQDRSYHKGISEYEALKEIKRCSGTQFDPYIAEKFIDMMSK